MPQSIDYIKIKKLYGENFAKYCRENLPSLLNVDGLLPRLLEERFAPTRKLFDSLQNQATSNRFVIYMNYLAKDREEKKNSLCVYDGTPEELFDIAGYRLYKCNTKNDVQEFMKYFKTNEQLCTFYDTNRINTHTIFFAVKKDVDNVLRADFPKPERDDAYGTSVISLQFSKDTNYLSIKNRYNHAVANCDATFDNDLDKIIPGLTASFEKYYGLKQSNNPKNRFNLLNYVLANDGKMYYYNFEINNVYYCENNIIIQDGKITKYDKGRYELIGPLLIDKKEKTATAFGYDSVESEFKNIKHINISKLEGSQNRLFTITKNNGKSFSFELDSNNVMTSFTNNYIEKTPMNYLQFMNGLKSVEMQNLREMNAFTLEVAPNLESIACPNLEIIGKHCISKPQNLQYLNLPKLKDVKSESLSQCTSLKTFDLPNLEKLGHNCFNQVQNLEEINLPNLIIAQGENFNLIHKLTSLNLPSIYEIGSCSFTGVADENEKYRISTFNMPNLHRISNDCFCNINITTADFPNLIKMGEYCFYSCNFLTTFTAPNLKNIVSSIKLCKNLKEISIPNIYTIQEASFWDLPALENIDAKNCKYIMDNCFFGCDSLTHVDFPNLTSIGTNSFKANKSLESCNLPRAISVGDFSFSDCVNLTALNAPNLSRKQKENIEFNIHRFSLINPEDRKELTFEFKDKEKAFEA